MKISLITMHRVPNYGSVLQTYALVKVCNKLGHSTEVVDYIPKRLKLKDTVISQARKKGKILFPVHLLYALIVNVPKLNLYTKFLNKYLKLTNKSYYSLEHLKRETPVADIYMTGSDQVWNTFYDGFVDPAFFLDYAPSEKKKVSYAASFGRGELESEEADLLKDYIMDYNFLSVRESSGVKIINDMGRKDVEHVLDPTLLIDEKEWSNIYSDKKYEDKYILMYTVNKDEHRLIELVQRIAKEKNLKIYYLNYGLKGLDGCDRILRNQSPEEFLSLFSQAEYVIATSFHGTAFALNFNKPFISILPEKFQARTKSLLKLVGLEDRMVSDNFSIEKALEPIDYTNVNSILKAEREKSMIFLERSLSK